jgi:hypothetical protein
VKRTFLVLLALAAPGLARELTVTTEPAAVATWAEPVHVIVRGTSATACGAAAVSLTPPRIDPTGAVGYIQLREPCNVAGPVLAEPFTAEVDVGLLVPALHQLVVRDEGGSFAGAPLEVGSPGTAVVEVVGPATSDHPLMLHVHDFGCPSFAGGVSVGAGVITVRYQKACPFTGGDPRVFELEMQPVSVPAGSYELRTISSLTGVSELVRGRVDVVAPGSCQPSDTTLCLHDRRFAVNVSWRDFTGNSGVGHAWETPADDGSGLFWFFSPDNAELTIKALDGCGLNQHWWIFLSSGSNVGYEVTVTDTRTGEQRTYAHPAGDLPPLLTDLEAFAGCS